jgi:hypothetical protein
VEIKRARMRWAGHVQRMPEERMVKKIFTGQPGGSRRKGRPREMGGRSGVRSEENRNKRMEKDDGG